MKWKILNAFCDQNIMGEGIVPIFETGRHKGKSLSLNFAGRPYRLTEILLLRYPASSNSMTPAKPSPSFQPMRHLFVFAIFVVWLLVPLITWVCRVDSYHHQHGLFGDSCFHLYQEN